ncbi:MAG: XdhC family protein [Candidatus Bathyarchaeota archaeon]|nr:XdhC family protein [Candidatus Bathyarchaeota archaeon]
MSDPEIFSRANEFLARGQSVVLCTLIQKEGSGPREPGSKMLVTPDGKALGTIGGGGMERLIVTQALEALAEGKPRTLHFAMGIPPREGMIAIDSKCGGEVKIFMDIVKPDPRLIIMGSGWIAQATARYAKECGFEVTVIDDAATAKQEYFPGMTIVNGKYPESLGGVEIRSSDFVAVLHGETPFELAALRHAAKAKPAYIGLLGSGNKAKKHKEQLKSEGFDAKVLDALYAPIGLDISAETPEEIGVSIVAEMIKRKRG